MVCTTDALDKKRDTVNIWWLTSFTRIPCSLYASNLIPNRTATAPVSATVQRCKLCFFGHVTRTPENEDHRTSPVLNKPLRDWRRPCGQPTTTRTRVEGGRRAHRAKFRPSYSMVVGPGQNTVAPRCGHGYAQLNLPPERDITDTFYNTKTFVVN